MDGFLVESGNARELAEKLIFLLESGDLRKRMGENARRKVKEKFTWAKIAN